jgi:hypothetical protein
MVLLVILLATNFPHFFSAAALEVLRAVGFSEDNASNEIGITETCLVLKRNDPGLLWLARSSLEVCNA